MFYFLKQAIQQPPQEQEEPITEDLIHCPYPNLISNVICKICFYLIQRPILVCNTCGYFACSKCILTWQSNPKNARCPLKCDKKAVFSAKSIGNLETILNIIRIKCKYSLNNNPEDKCPELFTYSDQNSLKAHQNQCPYKMVNCTFSGCTQQVCLKNAEKHNSSCSFNTSPCSLCGKVFQSQALQKHQSLCELRLVQCVFCGCNEQIKMIDKNDHMKQCKYRLKVCPACNANMPLLDTKDHSQVCEKKLVSCPVCKSKFPRSTMQQHLDQECPEQITKCENCKAEILRKEQMNHSEDQCIQFLVTRLNKAEEMKEQCKQEISYLKQKFFVSR